MSDADWNEIMQIQEQIIKKHNSSNSIPSEFIKLSGVHLDLKYDDNVFDDVFAWTDGERFYLVQLDPFFTTPVRAWTVGQQYYDMFQKMRGSNFRLPSQIRPIAERISIERIKADLTEYNISRYVAPVHSGMGMAYLSKKALRPYIYGIEVNGLCNYRCRYCYLKHNEHRNMSDDLLQMSIDRICSAGGLILNITGGEPSLHPNLADHVIHAVRKGLAVILRTNLYRLPKNIERLAKESSVVVVFSLHNILANKYDAFVGLDGAFDKMQRNIEILKHLNIKHYAQIVMTSENEMNIDDMFEWARVRDVPFLLTDLVFPSVTSDGMIDDNAFLASPDCVARQISKRTIVRRRKNCTATMSKLWISSDGSIYPCEFMKGDSLGHIDTEALEDIPLGAAAREWRKLHINESCASRQSCTSCEHVMSCPSCPAFLALGESYMTKHCQRTLEIIRRVAV